MFEDVIFSGNPLAIPRENRSLPLTSQEIEERYRTDEFVGLLATHVTERQLAAYTMVLGKLTPGIHAKKIISMLSGHDDMILAGADSIFFYATTIDNSYTSKTKKTTDPDKPVQPVFFAVPVDDLVYDRHMTEDEFGPVQTNIFDLLVQRVMEKERRQDPTNISSFSHMSDEEVGLMFEEGSATRLDYLEILDLARKHADPATYSSLQQELLELSIPLAISVTGNMKLFLSESDVQPFMEYVQEACRQIERTRAKEFGLQDKELKNMMSELQDITYEQIQERIKEQMVVYPDGVSSSSTLLRWYSLKEQYNRLFSNPNGIVSYTMPGAKMRRRRNATPLSDTIRAREKRQGAYLAGTDEQIDNALIACGRYIKSGKYVNILGQSGDTRKVVDGIVADLPADEYSLLRIRMSDFEPSHDGFIRPLEYINYIRGFVRSAINLDASGADYDYSVLSEDIKKVEQAVYPKKIVIIFEDVTSIKNESYLSDMMHMIRSLLVGRSNRRYLNTTCVVTSSAPTNTLSDASSGSPYSEGIDVPIAGYAQTK